MSKHVLVKETKYKGRGVFALKDFSKDEIILHIDGEVVETDGTFAFPGDIQDHWYPLDKKGKVCRYVLPKTPWKYLNHSCEPNAGIKNDRDIVAMKPIKKGQEITFDYAMNNIDDWRMECKCNSRNCRRTIGNFNMLDEETKQKYRNYVTEWTKEKYF